MRQKLAENRGAAVAGCVLVVACAACEARVVATRAEPVATDRPEPVLTEIGATCEASDQAFLRRVFLAIVGRRPRGQGEIAAVEAALAGVRAQAAAGDDPRAPRRVVVRALMEEPAFRRRWADFFMDTLKVARSGPKSLEACYGEPSSELFDDGELARFVRDHAPETGEPPSPGFSMHELTRSALQLDDLSVLYRAHLFAMMSKLLTGNASEQEVELARRNDFGATFETVYTNRNLECLPCHNSEYSVTGDSDPELNRFWPVAGSFERALFGRPSGPPAEDSTSGSASLRTRSMFRVLGVVNSEGRAPFGWDGARCGSFEVPNTDDPLGVDAYFGSVRGRRASVWDLERSLRRGVELLALPVDTAGATTAGETDFTDPDVAFAYLVGLNIVERVWSEVVGTNLTIAHHFPRTSVQREVLATLTNAFVKSRFSLKVLLLEIVSLPLFNQLPPSAACEAPYPLPRVFDAWADAEEKPEMRGNSLGDAVFPVSPRLLRRSLHEALEWPAYPEYPEAGSSEESLQLALGFALRDSEPGQRALDFQGRLAWEAAYGACAPLAPEDFVSVLAAKALALGAASVRDAFVALKDRLLGSSEVSDPERVRIEALIGMPLDSPVPADLESKLRVLCGVLVATPQFQLAGLTPADAALAPALAPSEASHAASCERLQVSWLASAAPYELRCSP
ncbi:MAG TPA: hypothetical protein VFU02_23045 [Polyangiaceae bacterium]|nr:hypothetical protein [Polyangiaceae bacterium]